MNYFKNHSSIKLTLLIYIYIQIGNMQIFKKLNQNNFNEVAKLIQNNSIPQQLMTGNIKCQVKRHKHSYSTPASIQQANKHRKTTKFGYRFMIKDKAQTCQCCNLRMVKQQIPFCQKIQPTQKNKNQFSIDDIQYKLTSDVALYFTFIKSAIFLMLINALVHSIFNIVTSVKFGNFCQSMKLQCSKTIWNLTSLLNKYDRQDLIFIVDILNLVGVIVSIIFFAINRRRQYRLSALVDSQTQTQSDYTLLISNIPILQFPKKGQHGRKGQKLQFFYRKHLQEYFNDIIIKWLKNKNEWQIKKDKIGTKLLQLMNKNGGQLRSQQIVKSVSLCYNLSRLQVLEYIKSNLVNNYYKYGQQTTSLMNNQNGQSLYSQRFASIPQRVNFLNDCQIILNGQFARDNSFLFSVTHFVGHAFVSFQYQHYKQYIQRLFIQNPLEFLYNGSHLVIQDASHPTDIYWQNIRVSQNQRRKKIASSYLILALVLLFTFVLLFLLELVKQHFSNTIYQDFIHLAKSYSMTLTIAIVILLINYGLNYLSNMLTQNERRKTRTDFAFSVLFKTFITKLINTIVLYFLVTLLFETSPQQQFNGRISVIFNLIIVSGVIHIIKSIVYPIQLYQRIKRWLKYRYYSDKVENKFQITLNKQFQLPQFKFAQHYSYYLVFIYTVFFYSYIEPIVVPAAVVILFIQYWVDKYILFRKSSLKYHYGFTLSMYTSKIFQTSVLALGLGNFIFSMYFHRSPINIITLVSLGISVVFTLCVWLTPKKLQNILFGSYQYNQKYTYDDCLHDGKFQTTYWNQNPATFLIQQHKVTGKKKAHNPVLNRKSIEGEVFLSSFNY